MQPTLPTWVSILALAIGPAVGGAIALIGAFGGPWLKARTDQRQWQRERRLDAYAALAAAAYDVTEVISQQQDVTRPCYALVRAASRVELVGPPTVREAVENLANYVSTLPRQHQPLEPAIHDEVASRYDTFMDVARHDLGVR